MKIPTYQQAEIPSATGPAAYSLWGERSTALQIPRGQQVKWAGIADFANSVTKIGDKIREAERVEEFSNALVSANDQMAELMNRIKTDPALINANVEAHEEFYDKEVAKIRSNITADMKSATAKDAFGLHYDDKAIAAKVKVRDLARNRLISKGRASTDEQLDKLADNMVRTGDEKALLEGLSIIQGKVSAGYFSAEEGRQLAEKFNRKAVIGYWNRRILDNPELAYSILKENPPSLKNIEENDKTALLAKAKIASEQETKEQRRNQIYADLKYKYGDNWGKAIDWLENPDHYKSLDLESRRYLINTFAAERSRTLAEITRYRTEKAREHYGVVVDLLKNKKYDEALSATEESNFISPDTKARIYAAAVRGDAADITNPQVYAGLVQGIHEGKIRTPEAVNRFRLNGLSNIDADKLVGKLEKPKYKEVLSYAEYRYKKDYPAKDDVEKHNRWFEFVNFIDTQLYLEEQAKGRSLTQDEGRKIVDAWLDPAIEEREWWFDKEYIPFFEGTEAQPKTELLPPERKVIEHIPRPVQDEITKILLQNGFKITPQNIEIYYNNNRQDFEAKKKGVTAGELYLEDFF